MSLLGLTRRALCLLLGLSALAACATSDEGATEFRSVGTGDATAALHQNVLQSDVARPIRPGEPLLVTLKTAYIKDFTEYFANPLRGSDIANGEIATAELVALAEALRSHKADTATKNSIAQKLSCAPPAATTIATRTT